MFAQPSGVGSSRLRCLHNWFEIADKPVKLQSSIAFILKMPKRTTHIIDGQIVYVEHCEACTCASIQTLQGMYFLKKKMSGEAIFSSEHGVGWLPPDYLQSVLEAAVEMRASESSR